MPLRVFTCVWFAGVLIISSCVAATPLVDAAHFQNATAIHEFLAGTPDLAARDRDGNTALHWAAINGDADVVRTLLARGAEANATNEAGATPLIYAAGSVDAVAMLLAHGAEVNHAAKSGATPLLAAARLPRSAAVVGLLLERGANFAVAADPSEGDPLTIAATNGDAESVRLLLAAGARPHDVIAPAMFGERELTAQLLDAGAELNFSPGFAGHALNFALYGQQLDIAQALIERGADLTLRSPRGEHHTPPIMWAAYNQTGETAVARAMIARGVDVNAMSETGDSALDWARARGHRDLETVLLAAGARPGPARRTAKETPQRDLPTDDAALHQLIRLSASRAIDLIQHTSDAFLLSGVVQRQQCVSCHQQTLPAVAYSWARERGLRVDEISIARQVQDQARYWRKKDIVRKTYEREQPQPDFPVVIGYGMQGFAALGYPADDLTEAMSWFLVVSQLPDGTWPSGDYRPPMEDGPIEAAAFGIRSLALYPLPGREAKSTTAIARARDWLRRAPPVTFNQRVFQLLGLGWAGENPASLREFTDAILKHQRADGGWAQLPNLVSDAWATGSALVALHTAGGIDVTDPAYARGVRFLLRTQFDDGSWYVRSRSWPFQPHFESGFPHGKDQWISAGATTWALMALLLTQPTTGPAPHVDWMTLPVPRPELPAKSPFDATPPASPGTTTVDYVRDVQPLLERSCYACHGGEKHRGDFSLATRESLLQGGQSGKPVVFPGDGAGSTLIAMVSGELEDLEMPPLHKREKNPALSTDEIATLRAWIDAGLPWSEPGPTPDNATAAAPPSDVSLHQ